MAPRIDWDEIVLREGFKSLEDLFVCMYNMQEMSIARLAVKIGVSEMAVSYKMREIGFPRRPHSCNKSAWRQNMGQFFQTKRR